MMVMGVRRWTALLAAPLLAGSLLVSTGLPAQAVDGVAVTSSRSFPKPAERSANLLVESTGVAADGLWESSDNPQIGYVKSPAELAAESKRKALEEAKAAREAAREAARQQQAVESSRSASRSPITASSDTVTASASGKAVVDYALQYLGSPYRYGGTTPAGWDCSGFTSFVYAHFGVSLSHQSESQRGIGMKVSKADAQPGDLMWKPGHVGIYMGNNMMVHASTPRTGTIIAKADYATFEYYRILN